jgi:hypothetical protein
VVKGINGKIACAGTDFINDVAASRSRFQLLSMGPDFRRDDGFKCGEASNVNFTATFKTVIPA